MAATLLIREKNGAGGTPTDKTSGTVRFKTADDAVVDSNDRISVPGTGQIYSYEKWLRIFMSVAPDVDVQNVEFYTDGANGFGAGVKMWARAIATFATPAQPSNANDPPEFPVNGTPAAGTDAFSYTVGAPLVLGAGPFLPGAVGTEIADHLVLVLEAEAAASQGVLTAETLTFAWDET